MAALPTFRAVCQHNTPCPIQPIRRGQSTGRSSWDVSKDQSSIPSALSNWKRDGDILESRNKILPVWFLSHAPNPSFKWSFLIWKLSACLRPSRELQISTGWLINNGNLFLTVLAAGSPQLRYQHIRWWQLLPGSQIAALCFVLTWWRGEGLSGVRFIRSLLSFMRVLPSPSHHVPKPAPPRPPPNTITLGIKLQLVNFGGNRHSAYLALSDTKVPPTKLLLECKPIWTNANREQWHFHLNTSYDFPNFPPKASSSLFFPSSSKLGVRAGLSLFDDLEIYTCPRKWSEHRWPHDPESAALSGLGYKVHNLWRR